MNETLLRLFDYHRFQKNARLAKMIAETESRYDAAISDDMLEFVNAAGEIESTLQEKK